MLRKKDMKPAVKYGIIAAAWLLFLVIGLAGNGETETSPSDIPPSTEAVIAQKTTETPTESTEPPTETREVSDETTVQFVESEAIKNLLFSISSWDTITEDSVKSSAESNGLEVDVDMGWGGTSWQYYFSDAQSKHCSLMLFFVHPQKENFAEHLKYFTLTFDGAGDVYLHYYSSWNRDNDDDGKYGFYVGDAQFEDIESAYEYYLSLVVS
jgi:hypothetical protein